MYSTYNRTRMYLYIKKQKLKNKDILNLKKKVWNIFYLIVILKGNNLSTFKRSYSTKIHILKNSVDIMRYISSLEKRLHRNL